MKCKYIIERYHLLIIFFVAGFTIAGCKKESPPVEKKAVLQGTVRSVSEYYVELNDADNVRVTVGDSNYSAITDNKGFFKIDGVPVGRYQVMFEKNGYMVKNDSCEIAEPGDTISLNTIIWQVSKTFITNLSMELNGYTLYAKGTITHQSPIVDFANYTEPAVHWDLNTPTMEVFCSKSSNVSLEAYENWAKGISADEVYRFVYPVFYLSGKEFKIKMLWPTPAPSSGETLYYIVYGGGGFVSRSNRPSNIFSLTAK